VSVVTPRHALKEADMEPMFRFEPQAHAAGYAAEGYVHIPRGLTGGFLAMLSRQVEE
jgi:hypothetical protein